MAKIRLNNEAGVPPTPPTGQVLFYMRGGVPYYLGDDGVEHIVESPTEAVAAHAAAPDPHPGYLTPAEANAAYAASGHAHAAPAWGDLNGTLSNQTDLQDVLDGKPDMCGFPVDASGNYLCTLTYNETTRTVTITPTGASFDVFCDGVKYNKVGAQSIAHSAVGAAQFVFFDETGTLVTTTTPWDLLHDAPVCFIFQDVTTDPTIRRLPFEERHHAGRDLYWHRNQHAAEGTKITSGFAPNSYNLNVGATDADVDWGLASGRVEDEDIRVDTQVLPAAGPYTILERVGASGDWQFNNTAIRPFLDAANVLQYNQYTGATWQRTNVTEDFFVNYWVMGLTVLPTTAITPAPAATEQIVIIAGQTIHATQGAATSESIASLQWGSAPFQEMGPLYRVTLKYNASGAGNYANTARCAIVAFDRIIGTSVSISQATQADHGALSGLADDDHPQYALVTGLREQTFKEVKDTVHTIVDGAAFEIDPANGSVQVVTLGADRTPAFTNFESGQTVLLGINDGTTRAITWPAISATWVWVKPGGTGAAPTLHATGYTWVLLWMVGSTIYAAEVGKP